MSVRKAPASGAFLYFGLDGYRTAQSGRTRI